MLFISSVFIDDFCYFVYGVVWIKKGFEVCYIIFLKKKLNYEKINNWLYLIVRYIKDNLGKILKIKGVKIKINWN